ncbi:MAG: hypothetical protein LBO82_10410 [Synergistaceae bacterium]|jgi:hypothetical protein|nr:hypothetical protein [Synergistaceae bacterium]
MFAVFSGAAEAGNDPLGFGDKLVKANLGLLSLRYSSTVYAYLDFKEEESADKAYNEHYRHDHLPLPLTVWEDWAADTAKLYKGLASNDVSSRDVLAFSFAASFDQALFEAQNPGYRSTSPYSYTDFEAEYKKRVERRQNFALETLRANNTMANASLSPRVPDMLQLHLSSSATLGYRQGLQAGSQTVNFMNQGLVLLRMDMLRQLEAETFFALDEAQEDSDKEAAFEVGMKWRTQATGKNY